MERSDEARREDGLYDRIGNLERLSRKKDERIKELEGFIGVAIGGIDAFLSLWESESNLNISNKEDITAIKQTLEQALKV